MTRCRNCGVEMPPPLEKEIDAGWDGDAPDIQQIRRGRARILNGANPHLVMGILPLQVGCSMS